MTDAAKTHKQIITVNGKNLRITIPAGIADGQTIKLRGQGGPGVNGGPAGDLYITFHIPEDSRFKRVGDDLYVTVPLNLYTAILGGEQIVETMDSKASGPCSVSQKAAEAAYTGDQQCVADMLKAFERRNTLIVILPQ